MKAVLQRVERASVRILSADTSHDQEAERAIGLGFVVLLGVARGDDRGDVDRLVDRITGMRVFADKNGKMNLSIENVGGQLLVVSQFTLLADTRGGRRPSFTGAAPPAESRALYEYAIERFRAAGVVVATGEFGAHMHVELVNDGPVTIVLDTREP